MIYFLAFILIVTFVTRQKLLRMLAEERETNKDLVDSILTREKPKTGLKRKLNRKEK